MINSPVQNSCKSCGEIFAGEYCNRCGQKVIPRFDASFLWHGLKEDLFGVESGLWLTFKELWKHPGQMPLSYINGKTKPYYGPLKYLIFLTAITLIISQFQESRFGEVVDINREFLRKTKGFTSEAFPDFINFWTNLIFHNTNLFFLGFIPFVSSISYLFYRKQKFNFTEHIILYTYFFGTLAFLLVIALIFGFFLDFFQIDNQITAVIFIPWFLVMWYQLCKAHKEFFGLKWKRAILNGVAVFYIGILSYMLANYVTFNLSKFFL